MKVSKLEHGATITITAKFKDDDGAPVTPSTPIVVVSFTGISSGATERATLALVDDGGGGFAADWDSAVANGDRPAFWNVRSAGSLKASEFGRIDFDHNLAGQPDS